MLKKQDEYSLIYMLLLVAAIVSMVSVSIIGVLWYKTINNGYEKGINDIRTYYMDNGKYSVKHIINNIINNIEDDRRYAMLRQKENAHSEFNQAYDKILHIYSIDRGVLPESSLSIVIKNMLESYTFNNPTVSYYIFDYKGRCILNPYRHGLEGKNLLNLQNKDSEFIIKEIIKLAKNRASGSIIQLWPYNWFNLDKENIGRKGIVFFRLFEPLHWVVVARAENDYIENRLENSWLRKLSLYRYGKNGHGYIFVIKLFNINGGKCFGKMLVNASNKKIVGNCISDEFKDAAGFQFRKVFLRDLRKQGYSFVKYHYYVPNSKKIESKISYFKLYKPWNWIIATGIYMPDLQELIVAKQKEKIYELNRVKNFILLIVSAIILIFAFAPRILSKILDERLDSVFVEFEKALDESKLLEEESYHIKQLKRISSNLNKAIRKFKNYENEFVESFVNIIEARDLYTKGHSQRVAMYSKVIAKKLGFGDIEQDMIYKAGLLHDIGKIGIPDNILLKPGRLSENEYRIIKYHAVFSYELLKRIKHFSRLADCVKHHHEKCDGSGYPDGLKCKDICIEARILAIADIFDALTTTRPYRKAFPPDKAVEILKKEKVDQDILKQVEDVLIDSFEIEEHTEVCFMSEEIDKIRNEIFTVDYMTGLLFITSFMEKTRKLIKNKEKFVVFRVNIRGLSEINYRFSADVGNKLISYTAKTLDGLVSNEKGAFLSRAYADVFLIILKCRLEDALKIMDREKIAAKIKELFLEEKNSSSYKELIEYIDISLSYAEYSKDGDSVEELIYKTEKKIKQKA